MRLRLLTGLAVTVASLALASPASAYLIQEKNGPESATNGIAIGPDGNFWIAEQYNTPTASVVRMSPSGAVLHRFAVGSDPTAVAVAGSRVWVSVRGSNKLVWFDALSAVPTIHNVATPSACGPDALAAGGGRIFFSMPSDNGCQAGVSLLASVADDGSGVVATPTSAAGKVRDLQVTGGKLFASEPDIDVVHRMTLANTPIDEAVINTPAASGVWGLTADGAGNIWATLLNSGRVARFAPTAASGSFATEIVPTGGTLTEPYGIVAAADGRIYVTGKLSGNIARISSDGTSFAFYPVPGNQLQEIINGTDGDLWITVQNKTPILRFINSAPRLTAGAASATAPTSAAAKATVNPRGNETQVVFDYGPTIAYGATTPPIIVANSADPSEVTAVMAGLAPGTTYHVRARASNPEGSVQATNVTFATPAGVVDADKDGVSPPLDCNDANPAIRPGAVDKPGNRIDEDCSGKDAAFPELTATAAFAYSFSGASTIVRKIDISRLRGGETATIRCSGRRCPFKVKVFKNLKKGKRTFGRALLRKRKLPAGATISVRVTKAQTIGTSAVLKVRKRKDPKITRACLQPGASKPSRCP